jgi:AcrR family transcriptional regulator
MTEASVLATPGTTAKAQRTKQRLLQAAERVFGANGFDRTSIADITGGAGVSQGTFYCHFVDKKAVFLALVDQLGRELRAALRAATRGLTDRLAIERAGFRGFFQFVAEHRDLYRIVRQAEFVDESAYRTYYLRLAAGYTRGLRNAMDDGQIRRTDPEHLAWCLMGMGDFLGLRWVLWEDEAPDIDALTDAALALLHDGIGQPKPRRAAGSRTSTRTRSRPRTRTRPRTRGVTS